MSISLAHIFRHPVKSVGSEALDKATLLAGGALVGDRLYAMTHAASGWNDDYAGWMACSNFIRIANAPALAAVSVRFTPETRQITMRHPQQPDLTADLSSVEGKEQLAEWIAPLAGSVKPPFRLVEGAVFTDSEARVPSIMSLASLRDLEAHMGLNLDPRRFRGNLWIDGASPLAELDLIGHDITIGQTRLRIEAPIERCRVTMANPETGARDADPLAGLRNAYDHTIFGVEARVIEAGEVRLGDQFSVLPL